MNRVTALLLAMATMLAHTLAIHVDENGVFAHPYEEPHKAFHLARNLVREGALEWNVGRPPQANASLEAYPSPLWVGVAAVAERLYLSVNSMAQIAAIVAALLCVALSARFDVKRLAGIIAPLLVVTSGAFAAAAGSGSEGTTLALFLTAALVAYQRELTLVLTLALAGLVATRPEGVVLAAVFGGFALADRLRRARAHPDREVVRRPPTVWSFLPAVAVGVAAFSLDDAFGASVYAGELRALLDADRTRRVAGMTYVFDYTVTAVVPWLLVFPVGALLAGRLSGAGARALVLAATWGGLVVLNGGGPMAFALAMVPAVPMIAIAIQQGIVATLDTGRRPFERLTWVLLLPSCLVGALASKFPAEADSSLFQRLHSGWLETSLSPAPFGDARLRGRPSLGYEIRRTQRLRALGRFLRENVDPRLDLLTPWPGAIGYLADREVLDLLGRATHPAGGRPLHRGPRPAIDLAAELERGVDLILPGLFGRRGTDLEQTQVVLDPALLALDPSAGTLEFAERIRAALEAYELVTMPVAAERSRSLANPTPYFLLRRRDLGLAPRPRIELGEGGLAVFLAPRGEQQRRGHLQLGRLEVALTDDSGTTWYLDPQGTPTLDGRVCARTQLRLETPNSDRPVLLFRAPLPELPEGVAVEARAKLYNPDVRKSHRFAPIGEETVVSLR